MLLRRIWLLGVAGLMLGGVPAFGDDTADDSDESPAGLRAVYTAGSKTIERIDADVIFDWGQAAPDPRLPPGNFQVMWTGQLLVQAAELYQFQANLDGHVVVKINGATVLQGSRANGKLLQGPQIPLEVGEQKIEIEFQQIGPGARLKLYWSAESFLPEPLSPQLLFVDQPAKFVGLKLIERGRELYTGYRCNRCHQRPHEPLSPAAPALTRAAKDLSGAWIKRWLRNPRDVTPHAMMPEFGFTETEAKAVAAFVVEQSHAEQPLPMEAWPPAERIRPGEVLFRSLGCLACHSHGEVAHGEVAHDGVAQGEVGGVATLGGGDLTQVGKKRSAAWIGQWLKEPRKLNHDARMPTFRLNESEIVNLTAFLAGEKPPATEVAAPSPPSQTLLAQGRKLVEAARCAACHRISGIELDVKQVPSLESAPVDWSKSCLTAPAEDQKVARSELRRPVYPQQERAALIAFVNSRTGPLAAENSSERGRRLLAEHNCLSCHPRGVTRGLAAAVGIVAKHDPELKGQGPFLLPPSLNAIGDKLLDEPLAAAVGGDQPRVRLPWLRVRMPRFSHSPEERAALAAYFVGQDRRPAELETATTAAPESATAEVRAQNLVAGHALVGGSGFSCIACHRLGKFEPRNVALGTRGSDLRQLAGQMRREFFLRWTRSPLRIVPGVEMPSYNKPVAGILAGDLDRQLAALWDTLQDPNFVPPSDPSVVQQVLQVRPGEPARILRDVFSVPEGERTRYVPRAFAVGFGNQHNLLFDLNRMALREWWLGEFARQRTEGKSWYWDMAGVRVATGLGSRPDLVLHRSGAPTEPVLFPKRDEGTYGRLLGYERTVGRPGESADGVNVRYELPFEVEARVHRVQVLESFTPETGSDKTGWQREISVSDFLEGFEVLFAKPAFSSPLEQPVLEPAGTDPARLKSITLPTPGTQGTQPADYYRLEVRTPARVAAISLNYLSSVRPETPPLIARNPEIAKADVLDLVPGYAGVRLPFPRDIMPTAITWTADGTLAFTSLKGQVYLARDSDGDGIEDQLTVFEEGLAAPYGILADGKDLLVAHKPELLRLRDTNGDGQADVREVIATGWGLSDNYHDWTFGIVRDSKQNLYLGLGSDYSDPGRVRDALRWRGKVVRVDPQGRVEPLGSGFRYPTGLALTPDDELFVSDNQGVQNTFNEINHVVLGKAYGVPSQEDAPPVEAPLAPAIQVPHPWTRSVNGLFFLTPPATSHGEAHFGPFTGHGVGCEYNNQMLIRFTLQRVGSVMQGATYALSRPGSDGSTATIDGPLSGAVSPSGDIYVGCATDSGWLGGLNVGGLFRLRPQGKLPLGIREIRALADGFEISFTQPVDRTAASNVGHYSISGYTRVWESAYATPDSGRHTVSIESAAVSEDGLRVTLKVNRLRESFVYEVTCEKLGLDPKQRLWPATGYYTLNKIPASK